MQNRLWVTFILSPDKTSPTCPHQWGVYLFQWQIPQKRLIGHPLPFDPKFRRQIQYLFNIAAEWGSGFPSQLVRTLYLCLDVFLSLKFNLWLSITISPILFCAPFRRLPRFLCPLKLNQFELFTYFIHPTYQGGAMVATLYTTRGRLISL